MAQHSKEHSGVQPSGQRAYPRDSTLTPDFSEYVKKSPFSGQDSAALATFIENKNVLSEDSGENGS